MQSIAILDDYQGVSTKFADWSVLKNKVSVTVFNDTLQDEEDLVNRLLPFTIICTMRERTKFTQSILNKLPNLRLITTTAMQNRGIDVKVYEMLL